MKTFWKSLFVPLMAASGLHQICAADLQYIVRSSCRKSLSENGKLHGGTDIKSLNVDIYYWVHAGNFWLLNSEKGLGAFEEVARAINQEYGSFVINELDTRPVLLRASYAPNSLEPHYTAEVIGENSVLSNEMHLRVKDIYKHYAKLGILDDEQVRIQQKAIRAFPYFRQITFIYSEHGAQSDTAALVLSDATSFSQADMGFADLHRAGPDHKSPLLLNEYLIDNFNPGERYAKGIAWAFSATRIGTPLGELNHAMPLLDRVAQALEVFFGMDPNLSMSPIREGGFYYVVDRQQSLLDTAYETSRGQVVAQQGEHDVVRISLEDFLIHGFEAKFKTLNR